MSKCGIMHSPKFLKAYYFFIISKEEAEDEKYLI